jgi:hypothetical protein
MIKKYILGTMLALSIPFMAAYASTPVLSVSGGANNEVSVQVTQGEINAPVVLYYYSPSAGIHQGHTLGMTDVNGNYSTTLNANTIAGFGPNMNMPVYVQVGGYQSAQVAWPFGTSATSTNSGIMFSTISPSLTLGGTGTVTLSGGNGTYYISSNSNMGGVSASISGNTLSLYGASGGTANITVCSTSGNCGTFAATVNTPGAPSLSTSSVNVTAGGQGSVVLSGGTAPYTISVPSGSGISTTLVGNTLYFNGNALGSNVVNVCSANGGCTPVTVNVQSQTQTPTPSTNQLSVTLPLTVGQALALTLNGGNGTYYLQSGMTSPALASLSGNRLVLNGQMAGSGTLTVCQTGGTSCLPINLVVTQPALTGTGGGWLFDTNLGVGMSGQDVSELQARLATEGYFTATVTGYFGPITMSAVQAYQRAHGIADTGYVGPLTRAELNR